MYAAQLRWIALREDLRWFITLLCLLSIQAHFKRLALLPSIVPPGKSNLLLVCHVKVSLLFVQVYKRLQEIDAYGAEARAATILAGLSFDNSMQV